MGNTAASSSSATRRENFVGALEISYAPTNRASCKKCKGSIGQGSMRIGRKVRSPFHDGFDTQFMHYRCGIGYATSPDDLRGWKALKWKDIVSIMEKFGLAPPNEKDPVIKQQKKDNEALWKLVADVGKNVKAKLLKRMLELNEVPLDGLKGPAIVYRCADGMLFGVLPPCPTCNNKSLVAVGDEVECHGWFSGATKCSYASNTLPKRLPWLIPLELQSNTFLREFKSPAIGAAAASDDAPAKGKGKGKGKGKAKATAKGKGKGKGKGKKAAAEDEDVDMADAGGSGAGAGAGAGAGGVESDDEDIPDGKEMAGMQFAFIGTTSVKRSELKKLIDAAGGTYKDAITPDVTTHLVAPESDVSARRKSARVKQAISLGIPIVSDQFVVDLAKRENTGIKLRQRKHWGDYLLASGPGPRLPTMAELNGGGGAAASSGRTKRGRSQDDEEEARAAKKKARAPIVAGSAITKVDEDVDLPSSAQIYIDDAGTTAYNCMLHIANIATGENKFYVIQVLKCGKKFYTFTKWGRVGGSSTVSRGWGRARENFRLYSYNKAADAVQAYCDKFTQMTGQDWNDRENFVQKPRLYDMIELQGTAGDEESKDGPDSRQELKSKLDPRVADFTRMIFDVSMLKKNLEAQNIDLKKMPLGSLSKRQLESGYAILRSIQDLIKEDDSNAKETKLYDASNRFYTTIPHCFSVNSTPPIIRTTKQLQEKLHLLESLIEVGVATDMMKKNKKVALHPDDANFASLKCELSPIDKKSDLYNMLCTYMQNTHAATHNSYSLEVLDIFEADRQGEAGRFKPWEKVDNHQLLWHGSRLTNWVGIISQGLRIAPPEAPVTGYMFGKGVYFANMVSKSANYCFTSRDSPIGVLMLCEVALGKTYNRLHSEYLAGESCKKAKCNSTWGQGKTTPDPAGYQEIDDGKIVVPMGKSSQSGVKGSLLYDEFIVYDTAQIRMRYIFKTKFKYKKSYW